MGITKGVVKAQDPTMLRPELPPRSKEIDFVKHDLVAFVKIGEPSNFHDSAPTQKGALQKAKAIADRQTGGKVFKVEPRKGSRTSFKAIGYAVYRPVKSTFF